MKKLSIKKKIFFLFVLLSVLLVSAEGFIYLMGWTPKLLNQPYFTSHDVLPYTHTPHYHFQGINKTKEYEMDATVNSLGFLDDEWKIEKDENKKRILFIGDSFTSGIARKDAIEYTNETERQLKNLVGENHVEILNMGIGGFSAEPERLVFETYGLRYDIDAVVLNFIINDVIDTHRGMNSIRIGKSGLLRGKHEDALGPWGTQLFIHSHFFRWALKILVLDQIKSTHRSDDLDEVYKIDRGLYKNDWQKCFKQYRLIKERCQQKGIPFYFVYLCQPESWTDEYQHVESFLKKFCDKNKIRFISLRKELNELASKELIYYPLDGHYQDNANLVVSKKVAMILVNELFN